MLKELSLYMIFGRPLFVYVGLLALICLLFTASIAVMNRRGVRIIPMVWHFRMAKITIVLAIIHAAAAIVISL